MTKTYLHYRLFSVTVFHIVTRIHFLYRNKLRVEELILQNFGAPAHRAARTLSRGSQLSLRDT